MLTPCMCVCACVGVEYRLPHGMQAHEAGSSNSWWGRVGCYPKTLWGLDTPGDGLRTVPEGVGYRAGVLGRAQMSPLSQSIQPRRPPSASEGLICVVPQLLFLW
jgi:hypothetical protein